MKTKTPILLLFLLSFCFLTGCGTVSDLFYETVERDTGEVVEEAFTDADGNVIEAGTPIFEEVHELKPWVRKTLQSSGVIPVPYADVLGIVATGILSIGGVWLNRKKKRSDKVAESLVKGIDTFRDTLDRTETGGKIDAELTRILHDQQANLQVLDEIGGLLKRYATPAKKEIQI